VNKLPRRTQGKSARVGLIQKTPKTPRRLNQKLSKINCSAKPSRKKLENSSRRQQHQGQQEIAPPITRGGAKGLPGGSDTLKAHNDSKKEGQEEAATPSTAKRRVRPP
jgi:hypothetical protein